MVLLGRTSKRKREREGDQVGPDSVEGATPSLIPWKSTSLPGATSTELRSKLSSMRAHERFSASIPLSDSMMNEIILQDRRYHLRLTGINVSLKALEKSQRLSAPSASVASAKGTSASHARSTSFAIIILSTLPESPCPIVLGRLSGQLKADGALVLDTTSIPLTLEIAPAPEGSFTLASSNTKVGRFSFYSVLESSIQSAEGSSAQRNNGKSKHGSPNSDFETLLASQLEIVVSGHFICIDPFNTCIDDDEAAEEVEASLSKEGNSFFAQEMKKYDLGALLQLSAKEKLHRRGPTDWFRGMCSNSVTPVARPETAPMNQGHENFAALPSPLASRSPNTVGHGPEKFAIDVDADDDDECPNLIPVFVVGGDDES